MLLRRWGSTNFNGNIVRATEARIRNRCSACWHRYAAAQFKVKTYVLDPIHTGQFH